MEGTQPSAAGGDGAPTAMVAVPGLPGALTQAFLLLGGSGTVSMEASLRLRAKDYAAHDRWLVNLQDVITSNRLDDLWENQQVPTLEAVQRQFSQETPAGFGGTTSGTTCKGLSSAPAMARDIDPSRSAWRCDS